MDEAMDNGGRSEDISPRTGTMRSVNEGRR